MRTPRKKRKASYDPLRDGLDAFVSALNAVGALTKLFLHRNINEHNERNVKHLLNNLYKIESDNKPVWAADGCGITFAPDNLNKARPSKGNAVIVQLC